MVKKGKNMATKKYYAVKKGRKTGVFTSWDECKKQIDKFSGAIYKSFLTEQEAMQFIQGEQLEKQVNIELHYENKVEKCKFDETEDTMIAYVDGSYNVSTKEFSYGMVILYGGEEKRFAKKVEDESLATMRNVAGEIKGAEAAMRYAVSKKCKKLVIYHDYEGIARWCLGEWKTNKEGTIAYKKYYDSIKEQLVVSFQKVKGHSGDHYNDMADELAKSVIF